MTEYEEKFSQKGNPINMLIAVRKIGEAAGCREAGTAFYILHIITYIENVTVHQYE